MNTHKPLVEPNPLDDPARFEELHPGMRSCLLAWIATTFQPAGYRQRRCTWTSYGLKHVYEHGTRIYHTNGEFKGAMLAAGYVPKDATAINWAFKDLAVRHARIVAPLRRGAGL